MTPEDQEFITDYPHLEEQYLKIRANDTSSRLAQVIVLRRPPAQTLIARVEGGALISSKEMVQEKRKGMKDEIVRREKEKQGDNFISYLEKSGRKDIIHEIQK